MYSLVLNGEPISVSIASLFVNCHLFRTKSDLLKTPYNVESGVSSDSLRVFAGAIGGAAVEISNANVRACRNFATNSSSPNLRRRSEIGRPNTR
jgi:hypothetical protein